MQDEVPTVHQIRVGKGLHSGEGEEKPKKRAFGELDGIPIELEF